jgi:predicted CxxxxCH...CXXCH cytochrome family protein
MRSAIVIVLLTASACADDRALPLSAGGVHPEGWGDFNDGGEPAFHGTWLAANKFPLSRCKQCHGADYLGGAVGVSCTQSKCHIGDDGVTPVPPDACTTCHGDGKSPRPTTGAHAKHDRFCDTCHVLPNKDQVEQHASGDRTTIVRFGNLATKNAQPSYDLQQKVCSNTYCHGASSPAWTDPKPLDCGGCHRSPPDNHAFWSRLSSMTCTSCHPDPMTDARHVNGTIDVIGNVACTTCHGSNDHANPPVDLAGGSDPTTRGVGAHARHLDPTIIDRISPVVPCNACHLVPQSATDPEHIGTAQRVRLPDGGAYDKQNMTCTVWCHFDRKPGPVWTDNSGAARACDACHGFPPTVTRSNIAHPAVAPNLGVCLTCHVYDKSSHANGVVNLKP